MTEAIIVAVARLAAPLAPFSARLRDFLARRPWLRLIIAPVILVAAACLAIFALLSGHHGLALLTLFIALPLATFCMILCREKNGDGEGDR